jgi:hypothetical protein
VVVVVRTAVVAGLVADHLARPVVLAEVGGGHRLREAAEARRRHHHVQSHLASRAQGDGLARVHRSGFDTDSFPELFTVILGHPGERFARYREVHPAEGGIYRLIEQPDAFGGHAAVDHPVEEEDGRAPLPHQRLQLRCLGQHFPPAPVQQVFELRREPIHGEESIGGAC